MRNVDILIATSGYSVINWEKWVTWYFSARAIIALL